MHELLKRDLIKALCTNGRIQEPGHDIVQALKIKSVAFVERDRHQPFVEPEGFNTVEIYVNGFSNHHCQKNIQYQSLRQVPASKTAKCSGPYAIEYDYFPTQLRFNLENKLVDNLFFAGQINGTTGYEEAVCQGLMAGINAHQK